MKNHEQMYQSLLSRWDEYQEQEKKLLFERKHRIKKMCLVLALTASAIVGCMSLGFGGYAVWNYVVKPIIIEEKEPEPTVTSHISVVTQITKTTEPTQTTKITEPTETTVTSAVVTETPAETTAKVTVTTAEPVTEPYEEEVYTEEAVITRPPEDIHLSQGYKQYMDMRLTQKKIEEYIEQNDVDAECYINYHSDSKKDKPLLILYINDKGRECAECYFKENNIDINKIKIEEMEFDLKIYIIRNRIRRFIESNDLSCYGGGTEYMENDDKNIVFFDTCVYESNSEEDIKTLKEYITYHGYDKIIPIVYKIKDAAEDTTEEIKTDEETAQEETE